MLEKRKQFFGRKRKMALAQAIEWLVLYQDLTEEEAENTLDNKRIKKEKNRSSVRGQRMR